MLVKSTLMPGALRFRDADEVFATLAAITDGWSFAPATAGDEPQIEVAGDRHGFVMAEQGREPIREATAPSAACTLVMIVLNRLVEKNPDWLCLHAGAVRIGGRTLVFPSTHRAGKSTLVSALALRRRRLVADDILPIDCTGHGPAVVVASGVLPRLRLPLPATLGLRFRVDARLRSTADDGHYRYVRPPRGSLAPFGERHEPDAFVFLERANGRPAELKAVTGAAAMRMLLMQNFGVAAPPDIVLRRIERMAEQKPAFLLRYDRLPAAVRLLEATFGNARCATSMRATLETAEPEIPGSAGKLERTPVTMQPDRQIVRRTGIRLIEKDGTSFLVDPEGGGIFGLDPLGAAIWQMLGEPTSTGEIVEAIGEAFPDIDAGRIADDVSRLAEILVGSGLAAATREG